MGAQKVLELKTSDSFVSSDMKYNLRVAKSDLLVKKNEIKNLKGLIKLGLSIVYFISLVFFLIKLLSQIIIENLIGKKILTKKSRT